MKNRTAGRKSRELLFQDLKRAIPTCQICTCIPSTPSYAAGVNLFVPLLTAAAGEAAVQGFRGGTNPSGRCQFCGALLYMEKQKVSVSPAVGLQPDGLSYFSSRPCVFLGDTAHFSIMAIKADTPHS